MDFKIGDSVRVKQGTTDPDNESQIIGGWQGRIVEIAPNTDTPDETLYLVEWDSITLKNIPDEQITYSERNDLDWTALNLYSSDLETAIERDSQDDTEAMQNVIHDLHYWDSFGEQGARIAQVVPKLATDADELDYYRTWQTYLNSKLTFPIQAYIAESANPELLKEGSLVVINSLPEIFAKFGVFAHITRQGNKYRFPLNHLEVVSKTSKKRQIIDDYICWFEYR